MKTLTLACGLAAALLPRPALAVDAFYWLVQPPVVLAAAPEPAWARPLGRKKRCQTRRV